LMKMKKKVKNSVAQITEDEQLKLPSKRHEAGTKPLMIIDGMNLAYAAFYSYSKLRYNGKSVSVIFGMPQMISRWVKEKNPEKVVVAWDGERSERRLKWWPEYKSHRNSSISPEQKADLNRQVLVVRKLIYYMGIAQAYNPAMEGDDMIYMLVKKYLPLYPIRIVSGDKDMLQLVNYDVTVDNTRTGAIHSTFAFIVDHGVKAYQYLDYQILVGDNSDDIPGYRGCGPVTAKGFLAKYHCIWDYIRNKKAEFSGLMDKKALKKIYKRNKKLMNLKWYNERYHTLEDILFYNEKSFPKFNMEKYMAMCDKYGLKTMRFPNFIKTFNRE